MNRLDVWIDDQNLGGETTRELAALSPDRTNLVRLRGDACHQPTPLEESAL